MRRSSLASRLTLWYAATVLLLVAGAAYAQYRTLVSSLAAEDDQTMLERLGVARANFESASDALAQQQGFFVRMLDARCEPVTPVASLEQTALPPSWCPLSIATHPMFRSWRSPTGVAWRIAVQRTTDPDSGWREAFLDRSNDERVLHAYRLGLEVVLTTVLLLSGALGYALARRGLAPLAVVSERIAAMNVRSLDQRLSAPDAPAEVQALVASFDVMLERLERAFRSLSEFAGHLAHEFRTPLHVLRQQAEIALTRARTPNEYRDVLASSLEELDRLRRMVDDILLLARTEDPRATLQRVSIDVQCEFQELLAYFEGVAQEQGITVEAEAPLDLRLEADGALVRRALVNLISNALRHTPRSGRILLIGERGPGGIALNVRDSGDGIPADCLPRIFEPYYRVPGTQADGESGSGLGLAIVNGIMHLHRGTATISSTPAVGTSVCLLFP